MRPISIFRFNALASYCREPMVPYLSEELAWFEHGNERVLGTLVLDRTDGDYAGVIFGRDRRGRFRAVSITEYQQTERRARMLLRREMERLSMAPDSEYHQGDEEGKPLDLFALRAGREKLNPSFLRLTEQEAYVAARRIIEPMIHWYEDLDGNFVEQFQTTGFDARIWELYLFAAFHEMGCSIDRTCAIPDFVCQGIFGEFAVEAVVASPTQDNKTGKLMSAPIPDDPSKINDFLHEYMPIKFGGPLTKKLSKKYWEKDNVKGKPLLFAIQDFSSTMSMTFTRSALPIYLYGYAHGYEFDESGKLKILPRKVMKHKWGAKEIPSGFFFLPDAEHVSAVIFSNSGTISKFNRMGVLSGFGSPQVRMIRQGYAIDHNPNAIRPRAFKHLVTEKGYLETWAEGLDVYHNPRARHPIDPLMLPAAAHYTLLPDGQIESITPEWHPIGSVTQIIVEDSSASSQG